MIWFLSCIVITFVFGKTKYVNIVWWMVVYLPLLAILATFLLAGRRDWRDISSVPWIFGLLVAGEVVAFSLFVGIFFLYPLVVCSETFKKNVGAARFWKIRVVSDWTMTYAGTYRCLHNRHTCQYQGDKNSSGLPHGMGVWMDDKWNGEELGGYWENGMPVAPFRSREYKTGNQFCAVRIAYFMASDDEFDENKLYPTNDDPPRCGVASVECSVSGAFWKPEATKLYGPYNLGEGSTVKQCCDLLISHINEEPWETNVAVKTSHKGLEVRHHVFEPTGLAFSHEPDSVVIDVMKKEEPLRGLKGSHKKFMPMSTNTMGQRESILFLDGSPESNDLLSKDPPSTANKAEDVQKDNHSEKVQHLTVRNWVRSPTKEALIYIGGFNSCLKHGLEILGQLVAMTTLTDHVYPILFAYPVGKVPTYRYASAASASARNKENFLKLIQGLCEAGIKHVHIMTHSMGVQTLMNAFQDSDDGSRSDVSLCFRLDPGFDVIENEETTGSLVCKSITMMNPDFPVEAFIDHAFLSIRRVCDHITVIGDRNDQALFWSQVVNGGANYLGYQQPKVLSKRVPEGGGGFSLQRVIGRCIDMMQLPSGDDTTLEERSREQQTKIDKNLLFNEFPPLILQDSVHSKQLSWLDVDVIDTTSLDTNIQNVRHSAFNMNPILRDDIEELILTGNRACHRSSLLYRKGNIFTYSHAPSFAAL